MLYLSAMENIHASARFPGTHVRFTNMELVRLKLSSLCGWFLPLVGVDDEIKFYLLCWLRNKLSPQWQKSMFHWKTRRRLHFGGCWRYLIGLTYDTSIIYGQNVRWRLNVSSSRFRFANRFSLKSRYETKEYISFKAL